MKLFLKAFVFIEKIILYFSYALLAFMTLSTVVQVILRYCFNTGFTWVEEVATVCIVWYGFISIAFGVIGKEHIAIHSLTKWAPKAVRKWWDRFNYLLVGAYGVFMSVYGWRIMKFVVAQTLPATKWSYSIVYAALPFAGALLVIFSLMVATGFVVRHPVDMCTDEPVDWEEDA